MTPPRLDDTASSPSRAGEELLTAAGFSDVAVLSHTADATVYRASQPALARTVAVRLQHEPMRDAQERRRFAEQCATLGQLGSHPNIVEVYGCDFGAQGRPYLVTELPTGETLAHRLQRAASPWRDVMEMGIALAGALETAHRAGVAHGHVRADDVLVSAYGRPQLADFAAVAGGGARATAQDVADLATLCAAALGGADDVPHPLRQLLDEASDGRFATAAALGRELQQLQGDLGCEITPLPLPTALPAAGPPREGRRRTIVAALAGAALLLCVAVAVVLVRSPAAAPPLLDVQRLGGEWQPDAALIEQLRAAPDTYLCRDPAAGEPWAPTRIEAYATTTGATRAGIALHELPEPAATRLLDDVAGQGECLAQLHGLADARVSRPDLGHDAVLVHYRRAGAAAPVQIEVVVARRGKVIGQVVHLGYPTTDPAVTAALQQALDDALASSAR